MKKSLGRSIGMAIARYFVSGAMAVLPLVITVTVVIWVAGILAGFVGPDSMLGGFLRDMGLSVSSDTSLAYLFGWALVLCGIFAIGVFVEKVARRFIRVRINDAVKRIPLLGSIYGTVSQLVGMMNKKENADFKAMSVVYCIFGKETGAAFMALLPTPEKFLLGGVEYHAVLIPTAPVPVGGSLIFVPADSVHSADIPVDSFMSVYVSMGLTGPQFIPTAGSSKVAQ